jgi:hypothetical protein
MADGRAVGDVARLRQPQDGQQDDDLELAENGRLWLGDYDVVE